MYTDLTLMVLVFISGTVWTNLCANCRRAWHVNLQSVRGQSQMAKGNAKGQIDEMHKVLKM